MSNARIELGDGMRACIGSLIRAFEKRKLKSL